MRMVVALALLGGCYRDAAPTPVPIGAALEPLPPRPTVRRPAVSALTPMIVNGAVLGQSFDSLRAARPQIVKDPVEDYDFRQHYLEDIGADGVTVVHYYTLPDEGVMYQISLDFNLEGAAVSMLESYRTMGRPIDDHEIVISDYPFEVRIWGSNERVQLIAVIEGNEWWDQYHPKDRP